MPRGFVFIVFSTERVLQRHALRHSTTTSPPPRRTGTAHPGRLPGSAVSRRRALHKLAPVQGAITSLLHS